MKKGIFLRISAKILCCMCLLGSAVAFEATAAPAAEQQQGQRVQGTVRDSNGEPLIGASVLVKGSTIGVSTNADGQFTIDAKANSTLVVSYVGFKTTEVRAKGDLNITLQDDAANLDDIVVLGYGASQKKQDLSASVGVVTNPDQLSMRSSTGGVSGALQGKIPGVAVSNSSGDPTGGPGIVIRGQGSPNGESVLWVVDGVPGAPMPQNDNIASIVVLKDAASASIYGAQAGAGGVILVTTKKAKVGDPTISYEGKFNFQTATNLPKGLNAQQQIDMRRTSYANANMTLPIAWDPQRNPWISETRTDWMDEIFRTAFQQSHQVAISANTEKFTNRISLSYSDSDGVLINTFNHNLRLQYEGSFQFNKWVKLSEKFSYGHYRGRSVDTSSGYTGAILAAIYMPSSATVYNPLDGTYGGTTTEDPDYIAQHGSNFADAHGDSVNPVRLMNNEQSLNRSNSTYSSTALEIGNIIPGLRFISRFTYEVSNYYGKSFYPGRDEVGKPDLANSLYEESDRSDSWKTENTITYDNTFGKHTVGALVSTTADHYSGRGFSINGRNLSSDEKNLQYISQAESYSANDWLANPDSNVSLIGRLSYSFDDRYFLTASFRRDWAGRLPVNKQHGDFPAVTGAWKISSEHFFPKDINIDLLKVRGSWGRIGNLGSIGTCYSSVNMNKWKNDEVAHWGAITGQSWGTMYSFTKSINPNLTWETSEQFDLGIDVAALNNRLTFCADYYNKDTKGLIQWQSMNWPGYIGLDAMQVNMGNIRNRGVEVSVGWNDKINKDFSYFVNANVAYNSNKVMDIGVKNQDGTPSVWQGGGGFRNIPFMIQTKEGGPLNQAYVIRTDGIFQSDEEANAYVNKDGQKIQPNAKAGDLKFVDADVDGKIGDGDREYRGAFTPSTTYAMTFGFNWKNLSFSCMLQGVGGAQALYVGKSMTLFDVEGNFNRSTDILGAWSPTNTGSKIPRLSKVDNNNNMGTPSDFYLEDADYLRIKNVSIGYDLTSLCRKCKYIADHNSHLEVFFNAENLATFTSYSGMDPECGGWDALRYPVSRTYTLGVRLSY